MTKTFTKLALMAGVAVVAMGGQAMARGESTDMFGKDHWQFRLRAITISPEAGGHSDINGTPRADSSTVPEFDISYFFTKNIAAELILATSYHSLELKNSDSGNLDLGSTMVLPPTLTLQYHFLPDATFSPYVGAGINYTLPYREDDGADVTSLKADGSFGYAFQAGTDIWLNKNWGVNFDVKKIYVDVDAKVNGTIDAEVQLDPWVAGAGVSYRF